MSVSAEVQGAKHRGVKSGNRSFLAKGNRVQNLSCRRRHSISEQGTTPLHLGSAGGPLAAYRIPILPHPSNRGCYTRWQRAQLTVGVPILPCSTCDQMTQLQTIGHEGKPTRDFCSSSALWTKRGRLSSLLPPSSLYLEWQGQLKVEWRPCDPEAPRG